MEFQGLLSLVHFGVKKQKKFLLYSINACLLRINFSINFFCSVLLAIKYNFFIFSGNWLVM